MNDSDTTWNTTTDTVAAGRAGAHVGATPGLEAVRCLRESSVPFARVDGDPESGQQESRLDLLVEPTEMEIAVAALRRAGYREMRPATALPGPRIFLTYVADRFFAVALHHELTVRGVAYLHAGIAFARRDDGAACLGREDRFLHVLLAAALTGRTLAPAQRIELHSLRRDGLDLEALALQTQRLGIRALVEHAVAELDALVQQPPRWRRFRWQLWATLLRRRRIAASVWRTWRAEHARFWRHPVLVAVVGPPHAGKTALASTLESQLAPSPLLACRLSMSCWQGHGAWQRALQALAPAPVSMPRLFRCRRGGAVRLVEAELEFLRAANPGMITLAVQAALHAPRTLLFHALLWCTMRWRYARGVGRCRAPLVIADGWILDLAFHAGLTPYRYGERMRRFVFRHFPAPDGIVYLSPSYELAAGRRPSLTRAQFESVDHGLRRMLRPLRPVEFVTDEAPRVVALTFLRRYWAHLLERHNRHV